MPKVNVVHVIGGGVLAGLIINVVGMVAWETVLAEDYLRLLGQELPSRANPAFWFWGFLIGTMAVWLYASMRTHYGPGPRAALIAGVTTWFLAVVMTNYAAWALGILGGSLMAVSSAIGLVELVPATMAGAWIYKPAA